MLVKGLMKKYFVFIIILFLFPAICFGWIGDVLGVSDGDSLTLRNLETREIRKCRLWGIDAPETKGSRWAAQPFSQASKKFLVEFLGGKKVSVADMGIDRYGRSLVIVTRLPDGAVAQEELLKAGLAWVYVQYCKGCTQLAALQEEAQKSKVGLWQDREPVPPWEWRKRKKAPAIPSGITGG